MNRYSVCVPFELMNVVFFYVYVHYVSISNVYSLPFLERAVEGDNGGFKNS